MAKSNTRYWLVKSEPDVFSFDDLMAAPGRRTPWDGVRNHQAKLYLRDGMAVGDLVLYYHSNAEPPAAVGIARVASEAYPDPTQFDPASPYFDPKAKPSAPTWFLRDIEGVEPLPRQLPLAELKATAALATMVLLQRGSRLSVTPVTEKEWREVLRLAARTQRPSPRSSPG